MTSKSRKVQLYYMIHEFENDGIELHCSTDREEVEMMHAKIRRIDFTTDPAVKDAVKCMWHREMALQDAIELTTEGTW